MTWSYSGDPSSSSKDAVRFHSGDTIATDPLVTDEEIAYLLTFNSNVLNVAVQCCEAIATKFAREADNQIGKLRVDASQKSETYAKRAAQLRKRASSLTAPYNGASEAEAVFTKGMHDRSES